MQSRVDDRLREEASRFGLRFTCEFCANFDPERVTCGNGYPTAPHVNVDLATRTELEFCKDFELG